MPAPHRWIAALLAVSLLAGCAGSSGRAIRHEGRAAGAAHQFPLKGVYRATIIPPFDFIGPIAGRISAETTDTGFIASTRPGIAWDMIGGVQGFLGSIFVPFIFPGGTIGTWTSTIPEGETPGEGWFGVGGMKSVGVKTRIISADQPVELLVREGRRVGLLLIEPDNPDAPPTTDYPALADAIAATVSTHLYDPSLVATSPIRAYTRQVKSNAKLARDDVEFIFGTVAAGRNHIKFTMPLTFPKGNAESRRAMKDWDVAEVRPLRATFDEKSRIAWLRVDAFLSAHDVDAAFEKILAWNPAAIMIDLRSAPGVTLASLRTISWVAREPIEAGTWFNAARRVEVLSNPSSAPTFTLSSAASVEEIESALATGGAARIRITPDPRAFAGPVAVLTSKRTSASAESLACALQSSGRARLFGQSSAGKPLLSRPFDIGQGWAFWLAAADYRTPTGEPIPASGLKPDFESSNRDTAAKAAEKHLAEAAGVTLEPAKPSQPRSGSSILSPFFRALNQGQN